MVSISKIRIVIVEDHRIIREGLCLILANEKSFDIVGEAGNGIQAIDVISNLKPDVILLDISMPEMGGIEVLPIIKQKSPATKTLMLTASSDDGTIIKALKAGARGYLTKNTTSQDLIKSIKDVYHGGMWIERKLVCRIFEENNAVDLNHVVRQKRNKNDLTPREQDVLRILGKGCTNKEIGQDLFISEKTVKSHLNRIFKKLDVSRRLEAILYAIKTGLSEGPCCR